MRTIRIYQPGEYSPGQTILLSASAAQHVGLVLHLEVGAEIVLFRGDDYEFQAVLIAVRKKHIEAKILSMRPLSRESSRQIHLAQSIIKGDKMEWLIQKAVELGVNSITPLLTDRCVVRVDEERLQKKQEHWQAVAISACEQSGRNQIPKILPTCTLEHYLLQTKAKHQWLLSPKAKNSWPASIHHDADLSLLIGPEGGFTEEEIHLAQQHQVQSIRLGPRVLRTETAAIVALGIVQMLYGDLV